MKTKRISVSPILLSETLDYLYSEVIELEERIRVKVLGYSQIQAAQEIENLINELSVFDQELEYSELVIDRSYDQLLAESLHLRIKQLAANTRGGLSKEDSSRLLDNLYLIDECQQELESLRVLESIVFDLFATLMILEA